MRRGPDMRRGPRRGFQPYRPQNGQPKLTDEQVRYIIKALRTHLATQHELAFRYRVSQPTIQRIWNRKTYKHIWAEIDKEREQNRGPKHPT